MDGGGRVTIPQCLHYVCSSLNQVFGKLQAKEMGCFSPSLLMERRDLLSSLDLAVHVPSHASCVMFHLIVVIEFATVGI